MKIVDANVLLYAVNSDSGQHRAAKQWLDSALSGGEVVGLPWISLLAFIRIVTKPIMPRALSVTEAFDVVDLWLGSAVAVIPEPTARHRVVLRGLLDQAGTAGNLTSDAHLAALAIEHGAPICSFDRDFGRFPGVRVVVPS